MQDAPMATGDVLQHAGNCRVTKPNPYSMMGDRAYPDQGIYGHWPPLCQRERPHYKDVNTNGRQVHEVLSDVVIEFCLHFLLYIIGMLIIILPCSLDVCLWQSMPRAHSRAPAQSYPDELP